MPWYFYLFLAAGAVILFIAALIIRDAVLKIQGRYVKTKVLAKLKGYSRIRGFRVLTDVHIPCKGGEKVITHVVVGIFGILVVDAHEFHGELYGTADDKKWTYIPKKGAKQHPDSLSLDLQAKVDALRTLLAEHKLYRMTIDSVNVVRNSEKQLVLFLPQNLPVIRVKRLPSFLNKSKYDTDAGMDIGAIADILTADR
ncbi:MAG: nuclease-related domain-containing protein [Acetanaerobacterium sp.]